MIILLNVYKEPASINQLEKDSWPSCPVLGSTIYEA